MVLQKKFSIYFGQPLPAVYHGPLCDVAMPVFSQYMYLFLVSILQTAHHLANTGVV